MPLTVCVGLSRKASKDFQSSGMSLNLTAELDPSLLARPQELQQQIDSLYEQARFALDRQEAGDPVPSPPSPPSPPYSTLAPHASAHGPANGQPNGQSHGQSNGHGNGDAAGKGIPGAAMSAAQRRAIVAIARHLGIDTDLVILETFGWELDQLSLRQASQVIDYLKSQKIARSG